MGCHLVQLILGLPTNLSQTEALSLAAAQPSIEPITRLNRARDTHNDRHLTLEAHPRRFLPDRHTTEGQTGDLTASLHA